MPVSYKKRAKKYYKKSKRMIPKQIVSYVKKEIRKEQEIKFHDRTTVLTEFWLNNPIIHDLCLVPQSTTQATDISRIGDHIKLVGLHINLILNPAQANVRHRIILFQWKPNSQLVVPIDDDFLTYASNADSRSIISPYYNDYENQYTILYDRIVKASTTIENQSNLLRIKLNTKYVKKDLPFYSTTTAGSNHIWLYVGADSADTTKSTCTYVSRLYFSDS